MEGWKERTTIERNKERKEERQVMHGDDKRPYSSLGEVRTSFFVILSTAILYSSDQMYAAHLHSI